MKITNIFPQIIKFLKEVRQEFKKVVWPTKQDTIKHTLLVVGISAVIALFLGGLDLFFGFLLNKYLFIL